jgi:hypothetical protein
MVWITYLIVLICSQIIRAVCLQWLFFPTSWAVAFRPERIVYVIALITLPTTLWRLRFWTSWTVRFGSLVIRSWSVAFPHVTDCPKGEVDVVAIRALPIIITPSSCRFLLWAFLRIGTSPCDHCTRTTRWAQAISVNGHADAVHSTYLGDMEIGKDHEKQRHGIQVRSKNTFYFTSIIRNKNC